MTAQQRVVRFAGRTPVETLHRTVVEQVVDPLQLGIEDVLERASLRKNHPHDPVAVLVRAALPRVVGLGEVDLQPERLFELAELRELLAVVECQGLQHALGNGSEHPDDRGGHDGRLLRRNAGDEREARHPLDQRDEVARPLEPVDEVPLPVPDAGAVLHGLGALVDVHPARDLAPTGVAVLLGVPVPRLALLPALRKRGQDLLRLALHDEPLTAVVLLVERFLADHRDPVAPRPTAGLLERPSVFAEMCDGVVPHLRRELPAFRGLRGDARAGLTVRLLVAVAPLALVALDLFRDCRLVASDPLGNVGE